MTVCSVCDRPIRWWSRIAAWLLSPAPSAPVHSSCGWTVGWDLALGFPK